MFRNMTVLERDLYAKRYIGELSHIYSAVQKKLSKKLAMVDFTLTEKYRTEALLKETREIIRSLNPQIKEWAGKAIENNYHKGVTLSGDRLTALKKTDEIVHTAQIHTSAVSVLAEATADDLLLANGSIQKTIDRAIRMTQQKLIEDKAISRMVAEGFIEGATRKATSDKILSELWRKIKDEKFITINGRQYRPDAYAELVARTRTAEAATQGEINTSLQYGNDLVQVSAHFMDEDPSDICYQYQGRVYSLSGADPEFPKLGLAPPYHPNCYSEDTEVYTANGWRLIKDVAIGKKVLSLNPENMDLEYVSVIDTIKHRSKKWLIF